MQRGRGEARGVALVADEDDPAVGGGLGQAGRARRVEAPLQHDAVDHDSTRQLALLAPVDLGADVDDEGPGGDLGVEIVDLDPAAGAGG